MFTTESLVICVLLLCASSIALGDVQLTLPGEVNGLFARDWPTQTDGDVDEPIAVRVTGSGPVTVTATDAWGTAIDWRHEVTLNGEAVDLPLAVSHGVYRIEARDEGGGVVAQVQAGIIPPFHRGIRPDSFFASNTSQVRTGKDLDLLEAIGMKVQRAHFQNMTPAKLQAQRDRHTWVLPIVGYADPLPRSEQALRLKQWGPPADFNAFVEYWRGHIAQFPEIKVWEFWNEPWIFEWTWADTPSEYRRLQRLWSQMALGVQPRMRIIAGNSWMFVQDHIEPYPYAWRGLLAGTTHHPYSSTAALTFRSGDSQRSIDAGGLINQRMGLERYYITEGGTNVGTRTHGGSVAHHSTPSNIVNARKLVKLFVTTALTGAFQGNAQWGLGYGPEWTQSNASFAVMTHLLEDRPIVADIWPRQSLLRGAIFASSRHVTGEVRALPRAGELGARWSITVPEQRADDTTKVAVVWSWTGPNNDRIDTNGTLTVSEPQDLRAFDLFGRAIPPQADGSLVVPFNQNPVYLVSDALSVVQLHERIATATIRDVTPVTLYAMPLRDPADRPQMLTVRVDNQMNVAVQGMLRLAVPGHDMVQVPYRAEAAELVDVQVPWPGVEASARNQYGIAVQVEVETAAGLKLPLVDHSQVIQVARLYRRTINIDGKLEDWHGITPITITGRKQIDLTRYLLNPHLDPPKLDGDEQGDLRVYSAYDDDYLYFAVEGLGKATKVGDTAVEGLPWKRGDTTGLNFPQYQADTVHLAFGFRDRVPGYGRQMNDPWAWKGHFYDTDYHYLAYPTKDAGDLLVRQWGPDTDRRTAYQISEVPHVQPVPLSRIVITDGLWEIAIPRAEVAMFDPQRGAVRLGLIVGGRNWSDTAGVFDYWRCSGSFQPAWDFRTPAQTYFGIDP